MIPPHQRYVTYLESLTPESLEHLNEYVTSDVRFKDPFNDVVGRDAMAGGFEHMFGSLGPVNFKVRGLALDGNLCLSKWDFEASLRGQRWTFDGMSAIVFNSNGRVVEHIDYWDAASSFYERLPFVGWVLSRFRGWISTR